MDNAASRSEVSAADLSDSASSPVAPDNIVQDTTTPAPQYPAMMSLASRWRVPVAIQMTFRPILVIVGLAVALLGQFEFYKELAFSWAGLGYAVTGALLFALAFINHREFEPTPAAATSTTLPTFLPRSLRIAAMVGVVTGTVALLTALAASPPFTSYYWTLPAWLVLIALCGVAVLPIPRFAWPDWHRIARPLTLVSLAIFLISLVLRAWNVGNIPGTLCGDEGGYGAETLNVLSGLINNPFSTGRMSAPTMTFFFNAPSIVLLGNTMAALRLPWALMGALNVLTVFWLATRLQGVAVGITTAILLAVYHYHIHYSRIAINNIGDPFFTALALLFFFRAYDRRSLTDWFLCGVAIGVGQYFYFGARFIVIVVCVSIACAALRDGRRFWREHWRGLLIGVGVALVTAAPIIQYALRFPDIYNARVNQTGIFQNGWLTAAMRIRGQSAWLVLLDQFQRAVLAYNAYPDRTVWYGLSMPLLDVVSGAVFLLGMGYVGLRLRNLRIFPMLAWWGGAIVIGGMLTENPPSSQRLITTAVPAMFFIALALVRSSEVLFAQSWVPARGRYMRHFAVGLAVAAFGFISLNTYFVDYSPRRIYGGLDAAVSTSVGFFAHEQLGSAWRIYFLGLPRMSFGLGSNSYLAPETTGVDVEPASGDPVRLRVAMPDKNAAFIILPERSAEIDLLRTLYPGGKLLTFPSPVETGPLYFAYLVPRQLLPAPVGMK
jgi:4-amino-4-deoxy-L-arabinose transferase-like glycosyltransferase